VRVGGRFLGGVKKTPFSDQGAFDCANSVYSVVFDLFKKRLTIKPDDVIVDIGCGKGRVINALILMGVENQIVGIELDAEIAAQARKRLAGYSNVTIIAGNALKNIPPNGTIFYLYNPFNDTVMSQFVQRLAEMKRDRGREVRIAYIRSVYLDIFRNDPRWTIEQELDCANFDDWFRSAIIRLTEPVSVPQPDDSLKTAVVSIS
jgi:ubiquinone/menaquinone biosynthesis C-methylase UbiE